MNAGLSSHRCDHIPAALSCSTGASGRRKQREWGESGVSEKSAADGGAYPRSEHRAGNWNGIGYEAFFHSQHQGSAGTAIMAGCHDRDGATGRGDNPPWFVQATQAASTQRLGAELVTRPHELTAT